MLWFENHIKYNFYEETIMVEIIIIEPNISEEENLRNLKQVEEVLKEIAIDIKIKEKNKNTKNFS